MHIRATDTAMRNRDIDVIVFRRLIVSIRRQRTFRSKSITLKSVQFFVSLTAYPLGMFVLDGVYESTPFYSARS